MQINPGVLNKKIQIIRYILSKDPDGFEIKTEEIVLKTWAQVSNQSGKEIADSNSEFSEVKTRFLIRTPKILVQSSNKSESSVQHSNEFRPSIIQPLNKSRPSISSNKSRSLLLQSKSMAIDKDYVIKFSGKIYEIKYVNDYNYARNYTEILTQLVEK